MDRKEKVYAYICSKGYVPLKLEELVTVLGVPAEDVSQLEEILEELELEGSILRSKRGRYLSAQREHMVAGTYTSSERGYGFVTPLEEGAEDYYIARDDAADAMHRDTVLMKIISEAQSGRRAQGKIVKVLQRATETLVCKYVVEGKTKFAIPDGTKIWQEIRIHKAHTLGAESGQKVVVKIRSYGGKNQPVTGEIVEILGWANDPAVVMKSLVRSYGLPEAFPEDVLQAAEKVPAEIQESDLLGRQDLRGQLIITIDGADARDLDDAVCVKRLENGNFMLGVHIADVSEYVQQDSILDKEALQRGTSVYLAGGVIPMLPPRLSNGICSLNPRQPRLTLSCEMEIAPDGEIVGHDIYTSVIQTRYRMTYDDVTKILEGDKALREQYTDLCDMLEEMKTLAMALRTRRMKSGSLDFDFPDAKLFFDDQGRVTEIRKEEHGLSNQIIEEFMLAANRTVAEHFFWLKTPFVYRVHEAPDTEKMTELNQALHLFGYLIKGNLEEVHPKSLQLILEDIKDKPFQRVVGTMILRSMMKARYAPQNLGHFGLSAKYYCHFTSPIRRYPDLMVHRIVKWTLRQQLQSKQETMLENTVGRVSEISSDRERTAEEAERASRKIKIAEYMKQFVGEEFDGIISSVTGFGLFVELENTVEGLVHITQLQDDYYDFIPEQCRLIGVRTNQQYTIGDAVRVKLVRTDEENGEIDFILVDE